MMRQWLSQTWQFAKDAFNAWIDDYAPSMGAALAYYTLFAIAPLLLIVIAVAAFFFGADAARGQIVGELGGLLGKEGATAVEGLLKSASDPKTGAIATIIGGITLVLAATTVFAELQSDLDRIWKVPAKDKPSGIWGLIHARFLSFGLIVGIGFLMIVSLALSAALTAFGNWYGTYFVGWTRLLQVVNFVVSFGVTTVAFAMVYKLMPSVPIRWRDVWVGAIVTSFLFTLGKYLIGLYIGKAGVASGFGAAGSLIVVLVWVYYSTQIFLLGAEFTHVYAERAGSRTGERKQVTVENPTQTKDHVAIGPKPGHELHPEVAYDARRSLLKPASELKPVGATLTTVLDFERASRMAYKRNPPKVELKTVVIRTGAALVGGWVAGRLLQPGIHRAIDRGAHYVKERALALVR